MTENAVSESTVAESTAAVPTLTDDEIKQKTEDIL